MSGQPLSTGSPFCPNSMHDTDPLSSLRLPLSRPMAAIGVRIFNSSRTIQIRERRPNSLRQVLFKDRFPQYDDFMREEV